MMDWLIVFLWSASLGESARRIIVGGVGGVIARLSTTFLALTKPDRIGRESSTVAQGGDNVNTTKAKKVVVLEAKWSSTDICEMGHPLVLIPRICR